MNNELLCYVFLVLFFQAVSVGSAKSARLKFAKIYGWVWKYCCTFRLEQQAVVNQYMHICGPAMSSAYKYILAFIWVNFSSSQIIVLGSVPFSV